MIEAKQLKGTKIAAQDGHIGSVHDLYFDDQAWAVRYLVIDTGRWLPGARCLSCPLLSFRLGTVRPICRCANEGSDRSNYSKQMLPQEISGSETVRAQLNKVLASRGFARNERLSGFLRFVVEQEFSGRGDQLKESVIGVEYFGRAAGYDVRQDSVVRNEAGKLRSRLAEYYVGEGATDGLII